MLVPESLVEDRSTVAVGNEDCLTGAVLARGIVGTPLRSCRTLMQALRTALALQRATRRLPTRQ